MIKVVSEVVKNPHNVTWSSTDMVDVIYTLFLGLRAYKEIKTNKNILLARFDRKCRKCLYKPTTACFLV